MKDQPRRPVVSRLGVALLVALLLLVALAAASGEPRVELLRNIAEYRARHALWSLTSPPDRSGAGRLVARIIDPGGAPIEGARLLVARWDGESFHARSDASGRLELTGLPAGDYAPVSGAPGYEDVQIGGRYGRVRIDDAHELQLEIVLPPLAAPPPIEPGTYTLADERVLRCETPLEASARRRTLVLEGVTQPILYYTPVDVATPLPLLLAVYPSPVDTWECVTIPLAAAGYGVIALSPPYSLDLERDVDGLERLVAIAREGGLPDGDPGRIAAMGGSYSGLLVLRLLERDTTIDAGALLGAPTDLFDMRRRYEREGFVPPFGLDRVLEGLGFPNERPLNYWRYSGAYHVSPETPPLLIFHSYSDEIIPHPQADLLAATLGEEGVPYELHFVDGASHYLLAGDEDALHIYDLTLDFLARELR